MRRATLSAALLAALALAAAAQDKKDRVYLRSGKVAEGTVTKDSWREVTLSTGGAAVQAFRGEDVLRIDYYDSPAAFRGAVASVEQEKWADALTSLSSADDYVRSASRDKNVVKPRPWFEPALAYYRGLCLIQLGRSADAIRQFDRIRKDFKESRFLADAFDLTLQAHREKGDVEAMDAFEKEIDAAPAEIKGGLKSRAERQRAQLLLGKGLFAEAKKLFEKTEMASDPDVAADSVTGIIKCLEGLKDARALEDYCRKVLTTAGQPVLLLIASNAMGDAFYEKKQFPAARDCYIASVVKYAPVLGIGANEHERALYRLACCYEDMMTAAQEKNLKEGLQLMTCSAFRQLSVEYPGGRHSQEAAAKAQRYEFKEEKSGEEKPKEENK